MMLITLREAARMLSVHPNTLRNWEKDGKIESVRIGTRRDRRFEYEKVMQMISHEKIIQNLEEDSTGPVH